MTAAELATCRRFSAAVAALDVNAALMHAHAEIELLVGRERLHGAAGLRTLLAPPALEYLERTIIVDGIIDAGECAVALGRIQLRWRDSDDPADTQHVGAVLDLREGRVVRWQAFPDPDSALAAAAAAHSRTRASDATRGTHLRARSHGRGDQAGTAREPSEDIERSAPGPRRR